MERRPETCETFRLGQSRFQRGLVQRGVVSNEFEIGIRCTLLLRWIKQSWRMENRFEERHERQGGRLTFSNAPIASRTGNAVGEIQRRQFMTASMTFAEFGLTRRKRSSRRRSKRDLLESEVHCVTYSRVVARSVRSSYVRTAKRNPPKRCYFDWERVFLSPRYSFLQLSESESMEVRVFLSEKIPIFDRQQ